jgi:hypothetical protein
MVPRNLLVKMFMGLRRPLTASKALELLKKFGGAVVITKKEDDNLGKKGLKQKMPKGWKWKDPYARYKAVGIILAKDRLGKQIAHRRAEDEET